MARAALPGRLTWQLGRVLELVVETPRCKSIRLEVPGWPGHRPGQHLDVRLTAEDGYQAERGYSIGSAPEDGGLVLTVERLDDGEVSPYLADELRPGDELELRGPIGGYFVWDRTLGGPVLMVAGGSGVVPFRAMLRHWLAADRQTSMELVYSARSLGDLIYREELEQVGSEERVGVRIALTRDWPAGWEGHRGRVDATFLGEAGWNPEERPLIYVCGPTTFVETVAQALVEAGHAPGRIKTERFGPTGT